MTAHHPRPSDTCPNTCCVFTQNVQGLKRLYKLEALISLMEDNEIHAYFIQETWLIGDWTREINGFTIFHHGMEESVCNRGSRGVAIILSPLLTRAYVREGSLPPITSDQKSNSAGRMIGINISFQPKGPHGIKRDKKL